DLERIRPRVGPFALAQASALRTFPRRGDHLLLQGTSARRDAERVRLRGSEARHVGHARRARPNPDRAVTTGLAQAATRAVTALAVARGIAVHASEPGGGVTTKDVLIGVGLALVLVPVAAFALAAVRRRRPQA